MQDANDLRICPHSVPDFAAGSTPPGTLVLNPGRTSLLWVDIAKSAPPVKPMQLRSICNLFRPEAYDFASGAINML
jgi:hypothetical protein